MTIICRVRAAMYSLVAALLALVLVTTAATARPLPGYPDLPPLPLQGHVEHETARIWYGTIGQGPPIILLHVGTASSRTWSLQVPALVAAGYRVILIDSRGHGRSALGRFQRAHPEDGRPAAPRRLCSALSDAQRLPNPTRRRRSYAARRT